MKFHRPYSLVGILAVTVFSGCPGPGPGPGPSPTPQTQCTALGNQSIATPEGNATIVSAQLVAAAGDQPEACRVLGTMAPSLRFEVRLPTTWNSRLLYLGGGGFDGAIPQPPGHQASQGYVTVASDGGHTAGPDETWAYDPEKLNDYAYRSTHKTMFAARALVQQRYGRAATRSYFEGCSNGGREALIQAQRYPEDFDGIIARAPAWNFAELMLAGHRNTKQFFGSPANALSAAKTATLSQAVLAACDTLDNADDDIISNPAACSFNPATLRCTGADSDACLTDAQISTVNTFYSIYRFNNNVPYYIGWPAGGESDPFGWAIWAATPFDGLPSFSTRFIRYFLLQDPNYNVMNFVPENHLPIIANRAALINASSTDYSAFRARGGKLLLWHGTNDWAISFNSTALYYNDVVAAAGGQTSADQFVEFFPAPGVQHCFGGPGPDFVDLLPALQTWTEGGLPPSQQNLNIVKFTLNPLAITNVRPLCKFPRYPRYNGTGNPVAAGSYSCALP
jgi:feruloyl esterase